MSFSEQYYKLFCKTNGSGRYSLVFSNKDALELSEIYNYFSDIEDFVNVQAVGDEKGLRFVRFKTFEAAKKAMDKTIYLPSIRLIPYGVFKSRGSKNENVDGRSKHEYKKKSENKENCEDASVNKQNDRMISLLNKPSSDKRAKVKIPEATRHHQKYRETINNKENGVPPRARADKEVIPLLATNASEVIVANLHHRINAAYVLHLVEKYEPLAISYVENVPYKNMRYCRVYFKTAVLALQAERKLDGFDLNGQRLIALRPAA